jgi:hypothetical protein
VILALTLALHGCAPYYANLARDFGAVVTSPSADLGSMMRTVEPLCRKQADLMYLRARLEDPRDERLVPWRDRLHSRYRGRAQDVETDCAQLAAQVERYRLMHSTLISYGAALRALAESQGGDFKETFYLVGTSLDMLARQVEPGEPNWGRVMMGGAQAVNQVLVLALSARTETDIRRAILAAADPVDRLLVGLGRAVDVFAELSERQIELQRQLLDKVERTTQAQPAATRAQAQAQGRRLDLLAFYQMALRLDEEEGRLRGAVKAYRAALGSLRGAHGVMVQAARGRIPPRQAVTLVQRSFRGLFLELNKMYDALDIIYRGPR